MNTHLAAAVERHLAGDKQGWAWVYFHQMTGADRTAFDRWLVEIKDPLAYQPRTTEFRFQMKVRENLSALKESL